MIRQLSPNRTTSIIARANEMTEPKDKVLEVVITVQAPQGGGKTLVMDAIVRELTQLGYAFCEVTQSECDEVALVRFVPSRAVRRP